MSILSDMSTTETHQATYTPGASTPDLSDIRLALEERESVWLDARAARSAQSRGRARPEEADPYRTEWQRDRDRIIHTKAFRRLKHKTQVFVSPEQDHYRTRLTHVLEVSQIARTVTRALRLNEDLTEAIGIGHDLGHAPFGHVGEEALDEIYRKYDANGCFRHYEQSLRIVDHLEQNGRGLNLTWEVRDGILHHSKGQSDLMANAAAVSAPTNGSTTNEAASDNAASKASKSRNLPETLEGQVVRICDRVAYVNHDIDDAVRAGLIKADDIPRAFIQELGERHSQRITTMVNAIIVASSEVVEENGVRTRRVRERIAMSDGVRQATDELKNWMFKNVYLLSSAERDTADETVRIRTVVHALFERFMEHPALMRGEHIGVAPGAPDPKELSQQQLARCVCDYVAGMTDRFASQTYVQLFLPSSWRGV